MNKQQQTLAIKNKAIELGFSAIGIVKSEPLTYQKIRLQQWLNKGFHGEMTYMENYFEKRTDPTQLVPGSKSIIVVTYNYHSPSQPLKPETPKIAQYAYGRDYHKVVKKKLKLLHHFINDEIHPIESRSFVDSAPVMEREWAMKAGLGWIGKNTLLIHPKKGSYFFIGELILDLELEYVENPINDYCGTCTRCIDACPTQAIQPEGYEMDGSKCISYATIEIKNDIPSFFKGKMENWIFGCDICQEVCPWNRFSTPHEETDFNPHPDLLTLDKEDWKNLTEEQFNTLFQGSAVKRTKYKGLKRNIDFISP